MDQQPPFNQQMGPDCDSALRPAKPWETQEGAPQTSKGLQGKKGCMYSQSQGGAAHKIHVEFVVGQTSTLFTLLRCLPAAPPPAAASIPLPWLRAIAAAAGGDWAFFKQSGACHWSCIPGGARGRRGLGPIERRPLIRRAALALVPLFLPPLAVRQSKFNKRRLRVLWQAGACALGPDPPAAPVSAAGPSQAVF